MTRQRRGAPLAVIAGHQEAPSSCIHTVARPSPHIQEGNSSFKSILPHELGQGPPQVPAGERGSGPQMPNNRPLVRRRVLRLDFIFYFVDLTERQ